MQFEPVIQATPHKIRNFLKIENKLSLDLDNDSDLILVLAIYSIYILFARKTTVLHSVNIGHGGKHHWSDQILLKFLQRFFLTMTYRYRGCYAY